MIWKKKKILPNKKEDKTVRLTVIPEIFYGGADPLIYHEQKIKKEHKEEKELKPKEEKVRLPMSRKTKIIIISVCSALVVGVTTWYYFTQTSGKDSKILVMLGLKEAPKPKPTQIPKPTITPKPTETASPTETPEATPIPEPTEAPVLVGKEMVFPKVLLKDSSDIDLDSLTDLEEEIFNTDSGAWDTDKDGYYDGQEVFNLYNPKGFAPVKLIDSGIVRDYTNPSWKYRVYYPAAWEAASVDSTNDQVIFSSINGDFVEIRAIKNENNESFETWFAKNIKDQKFESISYFKNRFGVDGMKREDSLVAYFVGNKVVFVIIYQPVGNASELPFRRIIQMMYQSFRLEGIFTELPDQKVLPAAPVLPELDLQTDSQLITQ